MMGYEQNMPYDNGKQLVLAGVAAAGGYTLPAIASMIASMLHPLAGAAAGVGVGVATAMYADRVFTDTDAYAKGAAIGGFFGAMKALWSGIGETITGAFNKAKASVTPAAAGFGGIGYGNTRANYVLNPFGQFQQAAAGTGQFQQALAQPFMQAQAGYGEYIQGTGEYVTQDGSMTPVSDFGEYVSSGISVQGYSDYEVMPEYTASADGFGYVNDGVHPGSNMDNEFNIIEAAAGLGASGMATGPGARSASNYIPSVQAGMVGSQGSAPDAGIFDVGGPNGVFG